ncbi:protein-disulfide reductase DsbD [Oceanobacter mangrovi]|uniref:protein-disulfide reductase DsbD n=1 Tax=Oceanobacter mangrovi TaxID=2862510 RepID=UPI001C8E8057|nr:protein-disulfide reductase DsbD [Oceanobacter mangrovi]
MVLRFALLLLLTGGLLPLSAQALPSLQQLDADPDFLPVDQAFQPQVQATADGWQVHFEIAPGYYLYQQRIKTTPAADVRFVQAAETKQDKNFGEVQVYHRQLDLVITSQPAALTLSYQGCSEHQLCYPPQTLLLQPGGSQAAAQPTLSSQTGNLPGVSTTPVSINAAPVPTVTPPNSPDSLFSGNPLMVLLGFLLLGAGLSLTPCVFPMVPILSSIIAGQAATALSTRRGFTLSLAYVIGMAASYALLGALVASFGASLNLTAWTQSPLVLGFAAALFALLSLSMFGLFELQLPAFLRNRLNQLSQRQQGGQLVSVAIMGFLSALVVSPCVSAPLAGALIYLSTTGNVLIGASALFVLGIGMGLPLLIIGLSGGKWLPRAGAWMIVIRQFFGVAMLAVAIALLARFLPTSISMLLAAVLAIGSGIYMGALEAAAGGMARLIKTLGVLLLLVGIGWLLGAARGSNNWLQPLASPAGSASNMVNNPLRQPGAVSVPVFESPAALLASVRDSGDQRPLLLDFAADWCTSCVEMDELLQQAEVQPGLQQYQLLRLDISNSTAEQRQLMSQLGIFGPPALQMLDTAGKSRGPAMQGLPTTIELKTWLQQGIQQQP